MKIVQNLDSGKINVTFDKLACIYDLKLVVKNILTHHLMLKDRLN